MNKVISLLFIGLLFLSLATSQVYELNGPAQDTYDVSEYSEINVELKGGDAGVLTVTGDDFSLEGDAGVGAGMNITLDVSNQNTIYLTAAEGGENSGTDTAGAGGFPFGGDGGGCTTSGGTTYCTPGGGGSTIISFDSYADSSSNFNDRIVVAAGGGAPAYNGNNGGDGGLPNGEDSGSGSAGGTQLSGFSEYLGEDGSGSAAGAGAGWYGGSSEGTEVTDAGGGGASNYVDTYVQDVSYFEPTSTTTADDPGYVKIWSTTDANTAPDSPSNPSPNDGNTGTSVNPTISVKVSDTDGDSMDVSFYDANDDSLIATDTSVVDGGTASVTWSSLNYNTNYNWYAVADDGSATTQSSTYSFTTTYLEEVSNSQAPTGSAWIEGTGLRWVDGGTESIIRNPTVIDANSPGPIGSVWIEGTSIRWIDQSGSEVSITGNIFDSNTAGPNGYTWIENNLIHYVDQNGDERVLNGS